jgi:transcriptional regulator with XRE-family HTH domain
MPRRVLAEKLGLTDGSIANWELERSRPGDQELDKLADIFEVTVDYLLMRTDEKKGGSICTPSPTPSPALATVFATMVARCKLHGTRQIGLFTGNVLTAEEIDRLRAGESPAIIAPERLTKFLRKMDIRDIVAWFDAAGLPVPPPYNDLEAEVRAFSTRLHAYGVINRGDVELVVRMLREAYPDE